MISKSIHDRIWQEKAHYGDFAILYRTNAQSRALEEALRKDNMPYKIYQGHSFYDRAEVKDILAYFSLVLNEKDNEAFKRIINFPARGIGDTTIARLMETADASGCSLFEAVSLPYEKLEEHSLKPAVVDKIRQFCKFIVSKSALAETADAYTLAVQIANESGALTAMQADNTLEGISRFENVEELMNSVKEFTEDESEMRKETGEGYADGGAGDQSSVITLGEYMSTEQVTGKIVNIKRPAALIFSAFSDLRNFQQFIPAERRDQVELDQDRIAGSYKGIPLGAEITDRLPFSRINFKDYKTKLFPFTFSICLEPRTDNSTDFHLEATAEMNPMFCKMRSKESRSVTRTSRALLPCIGPTIPAASSWSIILPARL